MSKIHLDILDSERVKSFSLLSAFTSFGYLAGGTALALQLGHRKSVDFDIFVNDPLSNSLRKKIKETFQVEKYFLNTSDQIILSTKNNISVTFLWYYFPLLSDMIQTSSIPLASVQDIAADKAMTIGRRAVWRDYVDIYFLLYKNVLSLNNIICLAQKKFKEEFVTAQFLDQLVYFEDVTVVPIDYLQESPGEDEIKQHLSKSVQKFSNEIF
jgi:predicted nucleotidyltransferase component of viral defense system